MRILFLARHYTYFRNFESAIVELAERGHTLHLAADRQESTGGANLVEQLAAQYPNVTVGWTPGREGGAWAELTRKLRLGIDYLRFLEPMYDKTPHLRNRAAERTPAPVKAAARAPLLRSAAGRRVIGAFLRMFERAAPRDPLLDRFLRDQAPDVVAITPLVDLGSPQLDHYVSARALGMRTALCVGSWDHLSSKSRIRSSPDLVTVWNDVQKQEAIDLHGVPAERLVATGAQCYDQWFDRAPSRAREEFCQAVGLDPSKPFIMYVASSLFRKTVPEAPFVEQWVQAIRSSEHRSVREAGILIRPHPARSDEWRGIDLSDVRNLAFFGDHAITADAKNDYFDSFYHASAVVGLTTSAFLEAGVAGKPVLSILLPEISRENQEGTIHFHYLLNVGGGLLETSRSFEEHLDQLAATLADPRPGVERARRFTEAFIRPQGLDRPSTPRFADAIEAVGRRPAPAPKWTSPLSLLVRALLYPWLGYATLRARTQPWRKETAYRIRRTMRHFWTWVYQWMRLYAINKLREMGGEEQPPLKMTEGAILSPKADRARNPLKTLHFPGVQEVEDVRGLVSMLGQQDRPVIVGPWVSETGFELLYWIPFLTWAKNYGNLREENLIVVSRGGTAPWYRHITPNYHDILSLYTPDEFRERNDARVQDQKGRAKHVDVGGFDREIVDRVRVARGLGKVRYLHPSLMYNLFSVFWRQFQPVTLVEAFTSYRMLPRLPLGDLAPHLPREYVAAKFYGSAAMPDTPANRALIASVLSDLTKTIDVVLLNTPDRYDDHEDVTPPRQDRLHRVEHLMTPETNLEVQTRIISGAKAFVGTYGGFSYLAPFVGTDTLSFYSHPTAFRSDHLELAKRVFSSLRKGSFVPLDVQDVDVVRLGVGSALGHAAQLTDAAARR